jgi:hypothetical protein
VNRLLVRIAAAVAIVASVLVGSAGPAVASCVWLGPLEETIKDAELAFVGTVASVANSDRWATVAVAEVWIGPDLPPVVEVRGGPGPGTASSVDRMFRAGVTYLFVPRLSEGVLSDNSCSLTTEWNADLSTLRPATARVPIGAEPDPGTSVPFDPAAFLLPVALIVGAGVVVFGAAFMIRRST